MTDTVDAPKVLVVDDEKFNRQVLTGLLSDQADVILAKDGIQALQKAKAHRPDLILLDVMMPELDGFGVLWRLKNMEETKDIAVIIVSALDATEDEARGLTLGAMDYIAKPFHPTIVKARVRNILNLVNQRKMLERLAAVDGLTEISNRRKFDEMLDRAWRHCQRQGGSLGLAMIDVDYFKPFNDHYGHSLGDEVLCRVARTLTSALHRPYDFCARYGGEEFVMLLPDTDEEGVVTAAENVRAAVEALAIPHAYSSVADVVTVSVGCSVIIPTLDSASPGLVNAADEMLYLAKQKGRNRVVGASRASDKVGLSG